MFLRDQPDYNILLDDVEFPEEDIQLAMKLTVAKWNAVTPVSNLTSPDQLNEYILLVGTCGFLLKSEGLRQLRNQMAANDGNIDQVGLDEKEALYMRWATHFQNEFKEFARPMKVQQNMESLLDGCSGFGSGYRYVGRYPV
jgi:hypothetical protein